MPGDAARWEAYCPYSFELRVDDVSRRPEKHRIVSPVSTCEAREKNSFAGESLCHQALSQEGEPFMEAIVSDQPVEDRAPLRAGTHEPPTGIARRRRRNTRQRRDKGKKLIKPRDLVVLIWIAQQYAARLDQVQELLSRLPGQGGKPVSPGGLTLSAVLQVVDRWVALDLVDYQRIYEGEPGWVWLTPHGLALLHLPYARLTPKASTFPHLYHINRVRLELERRHPDFRWTSERTLRAAQPRREEGAVVPHVPDAQVQAPKLVGVEVERSPKSDKELDAILTELLITGCPSSDGGDPLRYNTVWYFVQPATRTCVERARNRLPPDCQPRVKVLSLDTLTEFPPEERVRDAAYDAS